MHAGYSFYASFAGVKCMNKQVVAYIIIIFHVQFPSRQGLSDNHESL